jgi:DNA repair protein RadC
LIEETTEYLTYDVNVCSPGDASKFLTEELKLNMCPTESFVVIAFNVKQKIIGIHINSTGQINSCIAEPRSVFQFLLNSNAHTAVFAHNHTTDDVCPSKSDMEVTKRLVKAGKIIDIRVVDHIIVGYSGNFHSMRASNENLFA